MNESSNYNNTKLTKTIYENNSKLKQKFNTTKIEKHLNQSPTTAPKT